jgi:hypothetical protein
LFPLFVKATPIGSDQPEETTVEENPGNNVCPKRSVQNERMISNKNNNASLLGLKIWYSITLKNYEKGVSRLNFTGRKMLAQWIEVTLYKNTQ